jgi:hypothetical protein
MALVAHLTAAILWGCGIDDAIDDATIRGVNAIDDAIDALERGSADWQSVLQETIDRLTDEGQSTIRTEISNLLQRSVASASATLRCDIDFLRNRVRQALLGIKVKLLGGSVPPSEPVVCDVIPLAVDVSLNANRRTLVEFYGYDFDKSITAQHVRGNGSVEVGSKLSHLSHYHMTLNLGSNGVVLDPASQSLVLRWGEEAISTVAVIQPHTDVCRSETKSVPINKLTLVGKRIRGRGSDKEFDSNGPSCSTLVTVLRTNTQLKVQATFIAEETKSDWTGVQKTEKQVVFTAPRGWQVESLDSRSSFRHRYTDTDNSRDYFNLADELVKRLAYIGDTKGDDVGETEVEITFNPIRITLVETTDCVSPAALNKLNGTTKISPQTLHRLGPVPALPAR